MTGKNAWIVLALSGAVMLGCWFYSVGGVAGIANDPVIALSVLAIMVVIAIPIYWLSYRRWRRYPLLVEVPETPVSAPNDARFEQVPLVLAASRWKILAWIIVTGAFLAFILAIGNAQPGVCRAVSLLALGPLFVWNFFSWLILLFTIPRLIFSADGLALETPWRSRRWTWDEIGQVRVAKTYVPIPIIAWLAKGGGRVSLSVSFKRRAPDGNTVGIPQAGFRSIWKLSGEDLGELVNSARRRWSSSAAASWQPVRASVSYYLRAYAPMALIALFFAVLYMHPCGR